MKVQLLIQYSFLIKLMNKYDGTQCYDTPMKLYKDVFNPERKLLKQQLEEMGIETYSCEHGKEYQLYQICNCNGKV